MPWIIGGLVIAFLLFRSQLAAGVLAGSGPGATPTQADIVVRYDDPRVAAVPYSANATPQSAAPIPMSVGQTIAFLYDPATHYPVGGQLPGTPVVLVDLGSGPYPGTGLNASFSKAIGPGTSTIGAYSSAGMSNPNAMMYSVDVLVS